VLVSSDGFDFISNNEYNYFPSLVGVCNFVENKILFTDSKLAKVFIYDFLKKDLDIFDVFIKLDQPTGIVYDFNYNQLYISETSEHKVSVLDVNGNLIKTYGARGDDIGEFNYPTFLAVDEYGNLFIVDSMNFRLQIFDKDGNYSYSFGEIGDATGDFNRPKGIALDSYGHIFIVDALYHSVQVFDKAGNFLYNFGGLGRHQSRFWLPAGICIDNEDNIYIADSYNSRIQIYKLTNGN
ncbi:6-bladed beta-propeller, partial [Bacteroidota bacterium]